MIMLLMYKDCEFSCISIEKEDAKNVLLESILTSTAITFEI